MQIDQSLPNEKSKYLVRSVGWFSIGLGVAAILVARSLRRAKKSALRAESITIDRPPDELYRFWRDFQNLPRFMSHLKSVQVTGATRSHWVVSAPAGQTVEWDAEIIDDRPGERIAWRSLEGADIDNSGEVIFKRAPTDRGTEIHVRLEYNPPVGALGAAVARLFNEEPGQQLKDDLARFKQVIETGEVARSDSSIHGMPHPAQPPEGPVRVDVAA